MIIIHTGEYNGSLFVWAEEATENAVQPASIRGRPRGFRRYSHPFGTGGAGLVHALGQAGSGFEPEDCRIGQMTAWLPSRGSSPVPSSPLLPEPRKSRAKLRIAPWTVSAYRPSWAEAVEFISRSMGKRALAPGIIVGADTAYWADALRFAGSLVARQQFLPGLATAAGEYRAVWSPVLTGMDAERLAEIAMRMPASARALSDMELADPPDRHPVGILRSVVAALTDQMIRGAESGRSLASRGSVLDVSTHDSWVRALRSADGVVSGDVSDLSRLAEQVREWRRPIEVTSNSPFRLCFRLEEPEDIGEDDEACAVATDHSWYVRYLLQPHDDPSLLIPVGDVWNGRSGGMESFGDGVSGVREFLLSALGQASGICAGVAASMREASMDGFRLDTPGAHGFLLEDSFVLEQAGYGVLLPAWWTRRGTRAKFRARANVRTQAMQGGSGVSLDSILRFDWEMSLGGQELTLDELETLASMKVPLVRVRGQWVEVNADDIQDAIEFWKTKGTDEASARDIVKMALGAGDTPDWFDFEGVEAGSWVEELLNRLEGHEDYDEIESPEGFTGVLRPYQVRGYSWLSFLRQWGLGACLADDMGLGKTIQTLALIQRDRRLGEARPVLLVCPTSVINNWRKEAERFAPDLPVMVHHGAGRIRDESFAAEAGRHAIVISSYGLLRRDIGLFQQMSWSGIVLDEAQNVKNAQARQSMAARSIGADYRVALTGTPVENNVGDLWAIMEFLNPGFLGSQSEFRREFFVPIQTEGDSAAKERLRRITGPFILRRLKTDETIISDLPEKLESRVFCSLTREQASLYAAALKETERILEGAEGIERRGAVLGALSRLKQICNHPAQFLGDNSGIAGRSGKLERLTEMLEEVIEVGDRALIFSQFAGMGQIIQRHMQETFGLETLFLHGRVPKRRRDRMVERFQDDGEGPRLFVLSLRAGGTGLNLTSANHVFHFDRWWNPAVEDQATDRVFRIGQSRNVHVHKFICAGTLEDTIDEMIERKKEIAESVVGAGENWLTELSNEDLMEALSLRRDVVGG